MVALGITIPDDLFGSTSISERCYGTLIWFSDSFRFKDLLRYASLTVISEIAMFSVFITYMRQSFITDETSATVSIIANQLLYVVYTAPFGISFKFGKSSLDRARPHVRDKHGKKQYGNYSQLLLSFAFRWFVTSLMDIALIAITWLAARPLFDGDVKDHISDMIFSKAWLSSIFAYLFFHSTSALLTLTKSYKTQAFTCMMQAASAYFSRPLFFGDDLERTSADYKRYPLWVAFVSVVYGVTGSLLFSIFNRKKFHCMNLSDVSQALIDGWNDFFKDARGLFKSVLADTFLIKFIGYVVVFGLFLSASDFAALSVYNLFQLFLLLVVGLSLQIGLTHAIHHVNFDEGELLQLKSYVEELVRANPDAKISLVHNQDEPVKIINNKDLGMKEAKSDGEDAKDAELGQSEVEISIGLPGKAIEQGLLQYRQKRNGAIFILCVATFLQFIILPIGAVKEFVADQYSEASDRTPLQTDNLYIMLNTLLSYLWTLNNLFEGAGNGLGKRLQTFSRINNVTNGLLVGLSALIFALSNVNYVKAYLWVFFGTALLSAVWGGHTLFTEDSGPRKSDRGLMKALIANPLTLFAKRLGEKARAQAKGAAKVILSEVPAVPDGKSTRVR